MATSDHNIDLAARSLGVVRSDAVSAAADWLFDTIGATPGTPDELEARLDALPYPTVAEWEAINRRQYPKLPRISGLRLGRFYRQALPPEAMLADVINAAKAQVRTSLAERRQRNQP